MKKLSKIIYIIRIITFIIHFYLLFLLTHSYLNIGVLGIIFILLDLVYSLKIIAELLSKKESYSHDIVYNIMQIGLTFYLGILSYKVYFDNMVVFSDTIGYFKLNYGILSVLLLFIIIYSFLEFDITNK